MYIMDSMTNYELDIEQGHKLFQREPSRITRVARGAGVPEANVHLLLKQYKQFSAMVKKMGSIPGFMNGDPSRVSQRQMQGINQHIGKMMDPRMLHQVCFGALWRRAACD